MASFNFGAFERLERRCTQVCGDLENSARLGPERMREVMAGLDGRMRTIEQLVSQCSESNKAQDLYSVTAKRISQFSGQIRELLRKVPDLSKGNKLPDELWTETLTFLDTPDLPAITRTCTYFQKITSGSKTVLLNSLAQRSSSLSYTAVIPSCIDMRWNKALKRMYDHLKPISDKEKSLSIFDIIASEGVNITELDLHGPGTMAEAIDRLAEIQRMYPNRPISILSLKIPYECPADLVISFIQRYCPKLRYLELRYVEDENDDLQQIIAYLRDLKKEKTLQKLIVECLHDDRIVLPEDMDAAGPPLVDRFDRSFFIQNPQLKYFSVNQSETHFLDNDWLSAIAADNTYALANCPYLTNVQLCGCEVESQGRDGSIVLTDDTVKLDNKNELYWVAIGITNDQSAQKVHKTLMNVAERSGQLKTLHLSFLVHRDFPIQKAIQKLIARNPAIEKLTLVEIKSDCDGFSYSGDRAVGMRLTNDLLDAFPKTLQHLYMNFTGLNFARLKRIFDLCPKLTVCRVEHIFFNASSIRRYIKDYLLLREINRTNPSLSRLGELSNKKPPHDTLNQIYHLLWINEGAPDIAEYSHTVLSKEPTRLHACTKPLVSLNGHQLLEQLESDILQKLEIVMAPPSDIPGLVQAYRKRRLEVVKVLLKDDEITPKQLLETYKLLDAETQGKLGRAVWVAEGQIEQWQYGENRIKEDPRCLLNVIDEVLK